MAEPPEQPDLRFDIDAKFAHMIENLGHDLGDEKDWRVHLASDDTARLERVAEALSPEFEAQLVDVEVVEEDGTVREAPPALDVVVRGALGPDEVKALAARFRATAEEAGVEYQGVSSYDPVDLEELFGWLEIEDAAWRLLHFTDTGLEPGAAMPYVFAVVGSDAAVLRSVGAELEERGFEVVELVEDDDEVGVIVRCEGRNDGTLLRERYAQVEGAASRVGAELLGVQFFEPEEDGEA
jgi:hypothetical protein